MLSTTRRRIVVYLVITVLPLSALALYLAVDERAEDEARARIEEKAIVHEVRTDLDRLFHLSRSLVAGIGDQESDARICGTLDAMHRSFPEFFNLGLYEVREPQQTGELICSAVMPAADKFPLTPEETQLLTLLRKRGDIVVAPIRPNIFDRKPVIPVAGLVTTFPNGVRRLVAATVSLEWLNEQVNRLAIPEKAVLLVLDRQGIIAARNPVSSEWALGKPAPDFERTLPARRDFDDEIVGEYGIVRYYALAHVVSADGMVVVLKMQSAQIFRRSRQRLIVHLAGLFGIAGLVFIVAWKNSETYIARPLEKLCRAADRLASGNLTGRSGLHYRGEIGRVAHSFDEMAASLEREEIRNNQMLGSLRALRARLESVSEEERTRIAREIHDELGQQLTAMHFELSRLSHSLGDSPQADQAVDLMAMTDKAIRQVRKIATELRPVALDYGGLVEAVDWLARDFQRRTGVTCIVDAPAHMEASGDVAICLFRICQESLTNVTRHAQATEVRISLAMNDGWYTLTVRDNGRGFEPAMSAQDGSLGILGMGERARITGGSLKIASAPGTGTTVVARIPKAAGYEPSA
jgi:signal transduction histidine kinase